jgi:hypothetical protein
LPALLHGLLLNCSGSFLVKDGSYPAAAARAAKVFKRCSRLTDNTPFAPYPHVRFAIEETDIVRIIH